MNADPKRKGRSWPVALLILFGSASGVFSLLIGLAANKKYSIGRTSDAATLGIAALIFAGACGLVFLLAVKFNKNQKLPPWLRRSDWAKGEIPAQQNAANIVGLGIIGIGFLLGARWIFGNETKFVSHAQPLKWFLLAFGCAFLFAAFYTAFFRRKFGRTILKLNSVPGVIGGTLHGTIVIGARLSPAPPFQVRLQCLKVLSTRRNNRQTPVEIIWESPPLTVPPPDDSVRDTRLPVSFQIPNDCPETGDKTFAKHIFWRMEAKADLPGLDYLATFEVPVFKVNAEQRHEVFRDPSENLKHF